MASVGPIDSAPLKSNCLEDLTSDDNIYTHVGDNNNVATILFNPLVKSGVVQFKVRNM